MRALLLALLLMLCPAWAEPNPAMDEGREALLKGRFNRAVDIYQPLVDEGYESAELFYNLALAYQQINDRGHARAYYEKARLLRPWDRDTSHNLGRLRSNLDDPEPDESLRRLSELLPFSWLTALFGAFHLAMWTFFLLYRWRPRELYLWFASGFASMALLLGVLLWMRWTAPPQAAIVAESVLLKNGPGREFTDSLPVHAGALVSVLRKEGDWLEVDALGRVRAWLREEDICRVP